MKVFEKLEWSAIGTLAGVIVLFSTAIAVTLIAPSWIDPSWKEPSSIYQQQMYEVLDPNVYISLSNPSGSGLQYVYHLKEGVTLLAFQESFTTRIVAPPQLEPYITRFNDTQLKLTSQLLLLRRPVDRATAKNLQDKLQQEWKILNPEVPIAPHFEILELYAPENTEAFALTQTDGVLEHWARKFTLLGSEPPYPITNGTVYILNPKEYRVTEVNYLGTPYWLYNENGDPVRDLRELKGDRLRFLSRQTLIGMGEDIFRIEGCWYCHTDQTRTLVQDTVLNGSEDYPAPPSSANEYVFQKVSFPGTRRIGPDLSRVGVKRPHRDWHMSHFWSPKTESIGSIMPSFKHFFDNDPTGTPRNPYGVPNYRFEAVYQYLMTKGTRITAPDQAWWLGKDPVQTLDILEGRK